MSTTPIDYMVYFWRVAQLSMMFVCAIRAMGAPYLRFLQGRVAILPTRPFCTPRTNRVAYAFVVPALRKLREGRGTHFYCSCRQDQSLGHRRSGCST